MKWAKPAIDAGTSGLRGHVQVVVPYLSESYGSSDDPPDPTLPICSVKSFPEKVSNILLICFYI